MFLAILHCFTFWYLLKFLSIGLFNPKSNQSRKKYRFAHSEQAIGLEHNAVPFNMSPWAHLEGKKEIPDKICELTFCSYLLKISIGKTWNFI